ncbi:ring canal kelch homolog [Acyrthosiphon pisum]|uniref:BACK domain-containing protein n=1 Tax=Acyrthosiphon pisum TaxID=7029 RepID=A0A8R2NNP0_ACYPI|nr:ring canal kelch homolog [Acyrthosiphon pisum]
MRKRPKREFFCKSIFESVIRWVKHDLESRKQILSQLMEHVRLPLTSKDYILKNVVNEPLLINCSKCKDYVIEALHFHLLKSEKLITIPYDIRTKPRRPSSTPKVILAVGGAGKERILVSTEWYDPTINQWQPGPKMITRNLSGGLAVINDNIVIHLGGKNLDPTFESGCGLDLSSESPNWKPTTNMLVKRLYLGVGVGGKDGESFLNSAEVFDCRTREWHTISNMSTKRAFHGLGELNNLLYAVSKFG